MDELKPCPFCGGKAKICATTTRTYPNHGKHLCYCEKCGATGQSFSDFEDDGSSVFKAIEACERPGCPELWGYSCDRTDRLNTIPASDVVARDCYDRILAENDTMREMLARIGKKCGDSIDDVRPVVRGKWGLDPQCPVCGEDRYKGLDADIWADWEPPFCPNCGADMRESNLDTTKGDNHD